MTEPNTSDFAELARALNRYGHHDHDCEEHDLYTADRPCSCGFNQALQDALAGRVPRRAPGE